jgi:hypothetical protein
MDQEKAAFADRLRKALSDAKIDASAAIIEKRFNSRYRGAPVTAQAISGWLTGRHLPKQDKLRVLAELTGVDPHFLRFGAKGRVSEARSDYPVGISVRERRIIDSFLALPARRRELVGELVAALQEGPQKD